MAEAVTLDALTPDNVAGFLRPPELAVAHLPRATFNDEEEARLGNGRRVAAPGDVASGEAAAFGPGGRFLGIVAVEEGEWRPRKMIAGSAE